jgi:hypothetical protein
MVVQDCGQLLDKERPPGGSGGLKFLGRGVDRGDLGSCYCALGQVERLVLTTHYRGPPAHSSSDETLMRGGSRRRLSSLRCRGWCRSRSRTLRRSSNLLSYVGTRKLKQAVQGASFWYVAYPVLTVLVWLFGRAVRYVLAGT